MNINTWLGCGRLTRDADFSTTKKGSSMAKFRMAVNDRRNDDTLYLNVLCFGKIIPLGVILGRPDKYSFCSLNIFGEFDIL